MEVLEKMEDQWESCYWSQENKDRVEEAKLSARLETSETIRKGMCTQDSNKSPNILQHFSDLAPQEPTFCQQEKHIHWGDACAFSNRCRA